MSTATKSSRASIGSAFAGSFDLPLRPGSQPIRRRNPDAPLTPFAMPQYRIASARESERLNALAGVYANAAGEANRRADDDILAVVLFATALFFAGISTKLQSLRQREVLLALGWLVFLGTAIWLATLPTTVSI
jgi:hypothetical protein